MKSFTESAYTLVSLIWGDCPSAPYSASLVMVHVCLRLQFVNIL